MSEKKPRKPKKTLVQFLEEQGITSMVSPPMRHPTPGHVVYDCLLRREENCFAMHVRVVLKAKSPHPDICLVFSYAFAMCAMLDKMEGIDEFSENYSDRPVSEILSRWEDMRRMYGELHDLVGGCDVMKLLLDGEVQMERIDND